MVCTRKYPRFCTFNVDRFRRGCLARLHIGLQVTAKVAAIELENQSWPDLIETLLNNMQTPDAGHKRATLDALGYICENVSVQVGGRARMGGFRLLIFF